MTVTPSVDKWLRALLTLAIATIAAQGPLRHRSSEEIDLGWTALRRAYPAVNATLVNRGVTVNDAADDVVYRYEKPGAIVQNRTLLPRGDPRVQRVFSRRRDLSQQALQVFRAANP